MKAKSSELIRLSGKRRHLKGRHKRDKSKLPWKRLNYRQIYINCATSERERQEVFVGYVSIFYCILFIANMEINA